MEQVKRLKKRNIAAYGCGNVGWNFINFISNFGMLFMTDYMGMNAGIVASLIAISKVLDGITDIMAGTIIDRTKSKYGKARVWIIRMAPLMVAVVVLFFFNPTNSSDVVKYIWFFISYTLFNDVFYTMYLVSNSTMILFMTDNSQERVYLSILNQFGNVFSGAMVTGTYMLLIAKFGGGIYGWRMTAVVYGLIFLVLQIIYFLNTKEMPHVDEKKEKNSILSDFVNNIKYLLKNKFFILQFLVFFLYTCGMIAFGTVVPYYCIRVLGDANNARGTQTWMMLSSSGVIIGMLFAPILIKKLGMYKCNLYTRIVTCLVYVVVIWGALRNDFNIILIGELIFFICQGPYLGTIGVLTGKVCEYSKLKHGINVEATVSACTSMGTKIGNAIGVAMVGWFLTIAHYDGSIAVQPDSVLAMISAAFVIIPIVFQVVILILSAFMDVEKAVDKLGGMSL